MKEKKEEIDKPEEQEGTNEQSFQMPMYNGSTATKNDQGPIITQERSLEITIAAEKCRTDLT